MPSPRFPIPQGTLDMLILQILSLELAHGYGIAQRLEQISRSVVQVNQGSLYPALHRLQQKGWLRGAWKQSETGREARFYSLTQAGRRQLASRRIPGRASREQST
jgi:transcriptional regulator